jgi:hypothetical protein
MSASATAAQGSQSLSPAAQCSSLAERATDSRAGLIWQNRMAPAPVALRPDESHAPWL